MRSRPIASTTVLRAAEELSQSLRRGNFRRAATVLRRCPEATRGNVHLAAMAGDLAELTRLLDATPALIEAREPRHDVTPLLCAASSRIHEVGPGHAAGQLACARLLIERGADLGAWQSLPPTIEGLGGVRRTALALAIGQATHLELVRLLLDAGGSVSDPEAVRCAAGLQDAALLELLLERGADPNSPRALHRAVAAGALESIELLTRAGASVRQCDSRERSPLHLAVERELRPEALLALLRAGAELDAREEHGRTAYRLAVRQGAELQAELLLEFGADPTLEDQDLLFELCSQAQVDRARTLLSEQPELLDAVSDTQENLLVETVRRGRHAGAFAMLELGFAADAQPEGEAALHIAAERGDLEGVSMLIEQGATLDLQDAAGRTPLARVVRAAWNRPNSIERLRRTVEHLLRAGARAEGWMPERSEGAIAELFKRAAS